MKKNIILCLSIVVLPIHGAAAPDPWLHMTLEEKIDYLTNEIKQSYKTLEETRKRLVDMKIWIIDLKNGSLEFHCGKLSETPTYTIKNMHLLTRDELLHAMAVCFDRNGFDEKQKWIAHDLILKYLLIRRDTMEDEKTLAMLRKELRQLNQPYKPHFTT